MKKIGLVVAVFTLLLAGTSYAGPFIADTYLHPLDRNAGDTAKDVIGSAPPFDITGAQWSNDGKSLTISFDWNLGSLSSQAGLGSRLGDVIIYTNSGIYGVAVRDHGFLLGGNPAEDTTIKAGDIFVVSSFLKSDYYYDPVTGVSPIQYSQYGDNEIVTAFGRKVGSLDGLSYTPGASMLLSFADDSFANSNLRFSQTCGNDVYATPEPGSLLLFGASLIGLGFAARRRFAGRK